MRALWMSIIALSLCLALGICSSAAKEAASDRLVDQIDLSSWVSYSLEISPDGEHVAYKAEKDGKYFIVLDGKKGKQYKYVSDITFSPDSKRLAYVAQVGKEEFVVIDGQEGKRYSSNFASMPDNIEDLTFSPDSKKVAYIARESGKRFVVLDGVEGKGYNYISDVTFSPDSKSLTYIAKENDKYFIVFNNTKEELPYAISSLVISPDGKRRAYISHKGGKAVVLDDVEGKSYDLISRPLFSPDSKHLAYSAYSGKVQVSVTPVYGPGGENITPNLPPRYKEKYVVVDGEEGKNYEGGSVELIFPDSRNDIAFSPNSKRVAYRADKDHMQLVVVDGKEGKLFNKVDLPHFSPDSKKVAYTATLSEGYKNMVMVLNGAEGKLYDFIGGPIFSPDSKRIAYSASNNGKFFVVIDKEEGRKYDAILSIHFESQDKIHYLARNGGKLYRVEENLAG